MAAAGWRSVAVMRRSYQHTDAQGVFSAVERPNRVAEDSLGTQAERKARDNNALQTPHIPVKNMMCAFGVPGYMIHGTPGAGFSVIPVDFSVAPGMYTTYSHFAPVTEPVAASKLFGGPVNVYNADGVRGIASLPLVISLNLTVAT